MLDPDRLLVITHPVLAGIGPKEIERTIPKSQRAGGWDHVEMAPLRTELARVDEIDWVAAQKQQERLFTERLRPEIIGRLRLAYFGFAPIPLALHLGYRVGNGPKVDVYQRHHDRQDWTWARDNSSSMRPLILPLNLPEHGSMDAGPVVIRVSTSARIVPEETSEIVPQSLAAVDVALAEPRVDALETRGALGDVVKAFNLALSELKHMFPRLTTSHLFAAVPVGLAFRLGTEINPTMHPEVVTYQYWAKGSPRYRKAIVLGADEVTVPREAVLFSGAPFRDEQDVVRGLCEAMHAVDSTGHFLDDADYDWTKPEAERFHELMLRAYGTESSASLILAKSGIDTRDIHFNLPLRDFWKEALEVTARAGRTRQLARKALADDSITAHHPALKRLMSRAPNG